MLREGAELCEWDRKRLQQEKVRGTKPALLFRPIKHERDVNLTLRVQLLFCPQQRTEAGPKGKPAQIFSVREGLACKNY